MRVVVVVFALSLSLAALGSRAVQAAPAPPELTMAFSPASIIAGAGTTLTYTIRNRNPVALTNIAFRDDMTSWLRLQDPVTGSCGGTKDFISVLQPGPPFPPPPPPPFLPPVVIDYFRLTGLTLGPFESCSVTVAASVSVTANETNTNTTEPISASESGPAAGGASAQLAMFLAPPRVTKSFDKDRKSVV